MRMGTGRTGRLVAMAHAAHALPALAVTAFTTAVTVAAGVRGGRGVLLAAAVLAGQASVGWCNDWLDAAADATAGRRDKPVAAGLVTAGTLRTAALVALAATVVLSLALGLRPGTVHLVAVASAWAYDAGLKRTPASPLPYAVSFALVPPVLVAACLPGSPSARPAVVAASGLLGVAAHFANTVGDTDADRRTGVRGLPQRLGPGPSVIVAAALVAASAALLAVASAGHAAAVAGGVVAVALAAGAIVTVARRGPLGPAAFRLVLAAAGVVVVTFVTTGGSLVAAG